MKRTHTADPTRELTPLMWAALEKAGSTEALGSWDYASGVLGALKRAELVERTPGGRYTASAAGYERIRKKRESNGGAPV